MAEQRGSGDSDQSQEKTEEPTPRKREKAREEGQTAKSMEVNAAFAMVFGMLLFFFVGAGIIVNLSNTAKHFFMESPTFEVTKVNVERLVYQAVITLASTILPFIVGLMIVGVISNVAQVGFLFTSKPLEFSFDKLNPLTGIKRIIFSKRSLVELGKGIMKVLIVAVVAYFSLQSVIDDSLVILDSDIAVVLAFIGKSSLSVGFKMGLAFLALALLDYMFQRSEYNKKLRMSHQELKDELKETEGDPLMKQRIRSTQKLLSRKRMIADVPTADVIVTNPTHIAVALKYEIGKMDAPKVIAKGAELLAEKIKSIAASYNIPIVEDKPLAQTLYKNVDIGESIPEHLFQTVSQILAYVYKLKNTHRLGFGLN